MIAVSVVLSIVVILIIVVIIIWLYKGRNSSGKDYDQVHYWATRAGNGDSIDRSVCDTENPTFDLDSAPSSSPYRSRDEYQFDSRGRDADAPVVPEKRYYGWGPATPQPSAHLSQPTNHEEERY